MAGSARPSALDDGRVLCPLCGGLVHPVAGRCKHCKQDLATLRTGRQAAHIPLPPLQGGGVANAMPEIIHAIAPIAIPAARGPIGPSPVLPPRVTGRSRAVEPGRSAWKSWPMLVIVLASAAIIVALVMMVWPPGAGDVGKRNVVHPPAPERMNTDPLPPAGAGNSNGADPWGGHSQADPAPTPRPTPDPLPQAPLPDNQAAPQQDPLADPFAGGGGLGLGAKSTDLMFAAMEHACTKAKSCPNRDDTLTSICDSLALFPHGAAPNCDAAKRCFDAIDKLDCDAGISSSPIGVVTTVQDCTKALSAC
ncbi:hypothetical protein BH11MYX1_BH11MYX1_46630 [soil metagenome]